MLCSFISKLDNFKRSKYNRFLSIVIRKLNETSTSFSLLFRDGDFISKVALLRMGCVCKVLNLHLRTAKGVPGQNFLFLKNSKYSGH